METVFVTHPRSSVILSPLLFDGLELTLGKLGLILGHKRLHAQFSWLSSAHRCGAEEQSALSASFGASASGPLLRVAVG